MLITQTQLAALSEHAKHEFEEDLTRQLMERHPWRRFEGIAEALRFVHDETQRAVAHRITAKPSIENYVTASWLLGASVDTHGAEIHAIVSDLELAQHHRSLKALDYAHQHRGAPHE
ncbi:hypothetical protein [Chondromyces crocatus]|uniref:Uncharacterized protein n=1 Tax=Chondromyces crocatus TaxID=52 RepID=A0A0K1EIU9_CHOCO|nr:hypothetical protein [Chondromyces crocatus]AKT40790.1 uncharacterized protein CMC5_049460 [Chondromyces crocatus]